MDREPTAQPETGRPAPDRATSALVPGRWVDTLLLVVTALIVAAPNLGSPPLLVFDESYYVVDAFQDLGIGQGVGFRVHPPLGTWIIAGGVALVDGPVGWRLAPLLMGALTVGLLHRLAARLLPDTTNGRLLAVATSVLLVSDGSWLVLSRTGMLDGPLTTFVVGAASAAVAAVAARSRGRRRLWLAASGLAVGLATAVKWSGALAGPVVLVVLVVFAEGDDVASRVRRGSGRAAAAALLALTAYGTVWIPWTLGDGPPGVECLPDAEPCPTTRGLAGLAAHHASMARYHTSLTPADVGETSPAVWPLMISPIGFFRPGCNVLSDPAAGNEPPPGVEPVCDPYPDGVDETIRYTGNPVVWMGFLALLPFVAVGARRGDPVATVALAGWMLQWLPWLAASRSSYLWYMAPLVPFAALGLVAGARRVSSGPVVPTFALAAVGATAGALLALVEPTLGVAGAIIGWTVVPFASRRHEDPSDLGAGRAPLVVTGGLVAAAVVAAVLMRPLWVVT